MRVSYLLTVTLGSLISLSGLSLSGCALIKARPAKTVVSIPQPDLLKERRERAPFHLYWVYDSEEYYALRRAGKTLCILPIDITHVQSHYRQKFQRKRELVSRLEELEEIRRYFREKLRLTFTADADYNVSLVSECGKEDLILSLAIADLVPTNPGVNLVGTVAGIFLPGGSLIKYAGEGSIAMEGYFSGENEPYLYEQFADREGQKLSAFTLKDYQLYAHIREVIDDWAFQLAELYKTDPTHKVNEALPVNIVPY